MGHCHRHSSRPSSKNPVCSATGPPGRLPSSPHQLPWWQASQSMTHVSPVGGGEKTQPGSSRNRGKCGNIAGAGRSAKAAAARAEVGGDLGGLLPQSQTLSTP